MYERPPQIACRNRCLNMRLKLPKNIIQFFIFNSNIFDSLTNYYYKTQQHNTTQRKVMREFTINTIERDVNDHRTRVFPATIVISAQTFNEAVHKVLNRPQIRVQQIVSVNGESFTEC